MGFAFNHTPRQGSRPNVHRLIACSVQDPRLQEKENTGCDGPPGSPFPNHTPHRRREEHKGEPLLTRMTPDLDPALRSRCHWPLAPCPRDLSSPTHREQRTGPFLAWCERADGEGARGSARPPRRWSHRISSTATGSPYIGQLAHPPPSSQAPTPIPAPTVHTPTKTVSHHEHDGDLRDGRAANQVMPAA
jgi:hypothetical protein